MNSLNKLNSDLNINEEIKSLIRPLSPTEYNQLEESIKQNGCQSPIVVWKSRNIILDGHNRFEICMNNNIEFETTNLEFLNDEQAKIWVIKNQFGRRNLSYYERASLSLKLEPIVKEEARKNQLSKLQNVVNQNSDEREKTEEINTNKYLAEIAGVSHDTIARVRKLEQIADEETKKMLAENKLTINAAFKKVKMKMNEKSLSKSDISETIKEAACTNEVSSKIEDEPSLLHIIASCSTIYIFSTADRLSEAFKKMRTLKVTYKHCLVWDRDNTKSPCFFLITSTEKSKKLNNDKKSEVQVFPVYRENSNYNKRAPEYYKNIVKEMFNDEEFIKQFHC